MWKLIFYYSLIGGILLIFSRSMDTVLYYLTGYLFLLSYILVIALTIISAKKKNISMGALNYAILIVGTICGMTLLYSLLVFILVHTMVIKP